MKSTAHIKGHPLHPMLIVFPIAFFTATFLSDLIFLFTSNNNFSLTALYLNLSGIIFALLAAVPGVIDFIYTVPPKSSGKKRALRHGIINVSVVVLFTIIYFYRNSENESIILIVILDLLGVVALTIAGWMGGTLVYRNQIGVNPRTARAGKWKELYLKADEGR